jgi:hypothetical protein
MQNFPKVVYKAGSSAVKQTTAQLAQAAAVQAQKTIEVAKAQVGIPQSTEKQAERPAAPQPAPVPTYEEPQINREEIAAKERAMLRELENKLAQIRADRERRNEEWKKQQDQIMAAPQQEPEPALGFIGKAKKAMGNMGKKAKTSVTSLIQNRKQGETKAGSTKG